MCGDNGTCDGYRCVCEYGYYGDDCNLKYQNRFLLFWSGRTYSGGDQTLETLEITDNSSYINRIFLRFRTTGLMAEVVDTSSFIIRSDETTGESGRYVGSGILRNDSLFVDVHFTDGSQEDFQFIGTR